MSRGCPIGSFKGRGVMEMKKTPMAQIISNPHINNKQSLPRIYEKGQIKEKFI
jgi:hypothetical protein